MRKVTASEAERDLERLLDEVSAEPVLISRTKGDGVVMLSHGEYERLRRTEDLYWIARAKEGEDSGFLGADASAERLRDLQSSVED